MKKDKKLYSMLVIEDDDADFTIVENLLTKLILKPVITHAYNFKQAADILDADHTRFDIVLLDLSLPDKSGQQLITEMLKIASSCPIIILTGYADIDFSISSIAQGISDYLLKDELNGQMLYKSILYAIERKDIFSKLKRSEERYSDLFNLSPQPMWVFDSETFRFTQVNKAAIMLYGYSEEEFLNMTLMDINLEDDIPAAKTEIRKRYPVGEAFKSTLRHLKKSGEIIEVEIYATPIRINNRKFKSVIAIDVTEKNQYENKITRAIIQTQEDERYEIGGELHDNVCQLLAVGQLSFGMVKDSIISERAALFNKGLEYLTTALNEIRNISHRLAPTFFDESTLEEAFKKLFATFEGGGAFEIDMHFTDAVKKYPLSIELQRNLYRIMQEQLRNIQKYAAANLIGVNMHIYNNRLKMEISDNGVGFDINTFKTGIGLANMKRRTELFSGKFQINAAPGKGCTLIIDIPLTETKFLSKKADTTGFIPVET